MENATRMGDSTSGCHGDQRVLTSADPRWDFPMRRVIFHDVDAVARKRGSAFGVLFARVDAFIRKLFF
jgi:hypothetical protein